MYFDGSFVSLCLVYLLVCSSARSSVCPLSYRPSSCPSGHWSRFFFLLPRVNILTVTGRMAGGAKNKRQNLSVRPCTRLFVDRSVCVRFGSLFVGLYVCLSVCLFIYSAVRLLVHLSVGLPRIFLGLSLCPFCQFVCPSVRS